jgi:hypothetical protein
MMDEWLKITLYAAAAICFLVGIVGVPARISWVSAGLLAWVMVPLIDTIIAVE